MYIRTLVVMLLESEGYTVAEAGNGLAGLACLAADGFDGILLDINMPGMNGWEVCRRIKANPDTAHIPVIILTVRSMLQDQALLEEARPDGFVNKQFAKNDLRKAIDDVIGQPFVMMA